MPYKDPQKRKEAFRKYYEKNKEKILEKNRKWAADNPEKHAEIERKGRERRTGEFAVIEHDSLEEALSNLVPKPESEQIPAPEISPKDRLSKDELNQIVKDLKEIGL